MTVASASRTVGIIGLGFGRGHIPAFQAHGCEVVAVCQRDQKVAREVAARYGVPQVFERWEQMLAEARPDIVVIASPPSLHRAIAVEALAGGAHVLCEKPLAMDAAEGRAMIEAAQRAKRTAMTSFNWRYPAAMQRLHTMAAAGFLGRVFHVNVRWLGGRWADEEAPITWRMDRAQAGHGAMGDMGVHVIDLIRWSFGEFKQLSAQAGIAYPGRTVPGTSKIVDSEDFCSVTAELVSGAQVNMFTSRAARGTSEQTLEAYGTDGALQYRLDREKPRWWRGELRAAAKGSGFAPVKVPAGLPKSAGEGDPLEVTGKTTIAPLVKRFLAATRKGDSPSPSFDDGMRAQVVLDAVLESIASGGRMVSI
jgi:predicted dehydrogenase